MFTVFVFVFGFILGYCFGRSHRGKCRDKTATHGELKITEE